MDRASGAEEEAGDLAQDRLEEAGRLRLVKDAERFAGGRAIAAGAGRAVLAAAGRAVLAGAGRAVLADSGAIARQLASGQPLIRHVVARSGANVHSRVLARLVALARVLPMTERWLAALSPREPFFHAGRLPADADGTGLTEAARGALGHWVSVRHGRIARYQIVAPTSWNFSPRDASGTPGALEAALEGAPLREGEDTPVAVQHIVRSFDPCMVCTVH